MKMFHYILIVLFLLNSNVSNAEENLIIGMGGVKTNERVFKIGENILWEISKRMGVKIQLISLPALRATKMLRKGEIHAELSRIAAYKKKILTAIKVSEPIASLPFHAYTLLQNFTVKGWRSLKPYEIVYIRGHTFVDTYLNNHKTYAVDSARAAFRFLKAKRTDIYVEDILTAAPILNSTEFNNSGIKRLEPPVAFLSTYTFFSSKYPDFAKSYYKALVEIKKEGIYQKIFSETR